MLHRHGQQAVLSFDQGLTILFRIFNGEQYSYHYLPHCTVTAADILFFSVEGVSSF